MSSSLTWCNPLFPGFPSIHPHVALEYFCDVTNPFYDTHSLNQELITQRLSFELLNSHKAECILYQVSKQVENRLIIITKFKRHDAPNVPDEALAIYYILDGIVYEAPRIGDVINSRIQNCMTELEKLIVKFQSAVKFGVNGNMMWQFPGEGAKFQEEKYDEFSNHEHSYFQPLLREHAQNLIQQFEHETFVKLKEQADTLKK